MQLHAYGALLPVRRVFIKMRRLMRLTAMLLLLGCMGASTHSTGQSITLSAHNTPLKKVLHELERQSGYQFFFSDSDLKLAHPVTLEETATAFTTVLQQCFRDQPLTYSITGKTVVIQQRLPEKKDPPSPKKEENSPPIDIHGRVVNENGKPVEGVSVRVKGSSMGTTTEANGEFILRGIAPNATLLFSGVNIENFEAGVNGRTEPTFSTRAKMATLQDIEISKGYYTTTQRLNTGDVTKVSGEDIRKQPVSDPILALEGRVPGLYISQNSGIPGAYSNIQLRGQNFLTPTLRAQYVPTLNNPLYIVDGVPFTSVSPTPSSVGGGALGSPDLGNNSGLSPFNSLNPSDIESIDILKDADATAIYGSRGANGVILITTRKGKSGRTKFDLDTYSANGKVARMIPLMNTSQYLAMRREAFANDGKTPTAPDVDLNGTWDTTSYTDWQKALIGGTARFTNIQAAVSGGNAGTQFFINGGYSRQTTVFPGNTYDQKVFASFNLNHISVNKKFHTLLSGGYTKGTNVMPGGDFTGNINIAPNAPSNLIDANGNLNFNIPFGNPYVNLKRSAKAVTNNLVANLTMDYEILPGLQAKSSFGYTHMVLNQVDLSPAATYPSPNTNNPLYRTNSFGSTETETWIIEPQLNYSKKISQAKLDIIAGSTFQQNIQNELGQNATNFSSDDIIQNIALASSVTVVANKNIKYHYSGIYGRIGYNYEDKYLINATVRRDGSSRFGPGKQMGNFGAVGAAWIFSQEKFVQQALPFLSLGKIKGSYGVTGNDQILDYQYLSLYQGYTSSTYQGLTGLYPTQIANPDYAWESVTKLEGGIELGFLHDRVLINANYYRNRTGNQLVGYALPSTDGFSSIYANLPAVVQNSGFEMMLNTVNVRANGFSWSSSFNLSVPRNKLVSYPGLASSAYAKRYQVGQSVYIKYLYHTTGVDPQTGAYNVVDIDKNGAINSLDNQFVKDVTQHYYGGFLNTLSYKGIQLDVLFQFVKQTGNNYMKTFTLPGYFNGGRSNQPTYVLSRWRQAGDNTGVQQFTQQTAATGPGRAFINGVTNGDYYITDASFIRLKNVSLSYQLPAKWTDKAHINSIRVYMQAQNLLTITHYQGIDPETQSLSLPPLRMIAAGIHASL